MIVFFEHVFDFAI